MSFVQRYGIEPDLVFHDWSCLLKAKRPLADVVIICTQDKDHAAPAIAFAGLGYHILLEKPSNNAATVDIVESWKNDICDSSSVRLDPLVIDHLN